MLCSFFTSTTYCSGMLRLSCCFADSRWSWNVKSQFQPGFQALGIWDSLDEGFSFRSLHRCDTAVMSKWLLGLSLGVTLLPLSEQGCSCLLLAANLDPKLPETNNKRSFNVSLVTEVWWFFSSTDLASCFWKFCRGWRKGRAVNPSVDWANTTL